jgi:type I restriction enzyme S subunit
MKSLKPYFTQIATNKQTTGLGHITIADIKRMSVVIPSLSEQRRIVALIKPVDDKIELNNRINDNYVFTFISVALAPERFVSEKDIKR